MKDILTSGWSLLIRTMASDIGVFSNEYEYLYALAEMKVITAITMVRTVFILSLDNQCIAVLPDVDMPECVELRHDFVKRQCGIEAIVQMERGCLTVDDSDIHTV